MYLLHVLLLLSFLVMLAERYPIETLLIATMVVVGAWEVLVVAVCILRQAAQMVLEHERVVTMIEIHADSVWARRDEIVLLTAAHASVATVQR